MAERMYVLAQKTRPHRAHAACDRRALLVGAAAFLAAVLAIALADAVTPYWFRPRSLLVLVPVVAGLTASRCVTLLTSLLSIGAYAVLAAAYPPPGASTLSWVGSLGMVGGVLAGQAAIVIRAAQRKRLAAVADVAESVQLAVMRPVPGALGDLRIADAYRPAAKAARLGGDWYDVQPSPHGFRAVLGDVSGKGMPAVSASAALLAAFREAGYHEPDLDEVARRLEIAMRRHNSWARTCGDGTEHFSTALLMEFDDDGVEVIGFGHEPPLLVRPDGEVAEVPVTPDLPLGLRDLGALGEVLPDGPRRRRVALRPGETLVLVTDGVTECRDRHGAFYPLRERVARLAAAGAVGADALRTALVADLDTHRAGETADDTALLLIHRAPSPVPYPRGTEHALYAPA